MSKAKSQQNVRSLMYGVRLNFSLVVAIMVASSFVMMAFIATGANEAIVLHEERFQEARDDLGPALQQIAQEDPALAQQAAEELLTDYKKQNRDLLTRITPVVIAGSAVIAYILARYMTRPIREAYYAQERFLQDAAHELRNPLAALKITTQNIRAKKQITRDDALRLLKTTESQVDRLIKINENLLFLDRNEQQKKPEHANLSELSSDVVEDLTPFANQRKLTIIENIQPNIVRRIEPDDYVRLTRNILENAIKYSTRSSKEIRFSLSEKGGKVRLSVRDFGIGIPSEQLHQLGQRFFRASNTSAFDGSGLGMAIMQKIATKYGGTLTVNSSEGEGTHVVVNL